MDSERVLGALQWARSAVGPRRSRTIGFARGTNEKRHRTGDEAIVRHRRLSGAASAIAVAGVDPRHDRVHDSGVAGDGHCFARELIELDDPRQRTRLGR
jgi:hypothetical protein